MTFHFDYLLYNEIKICILFIRKRRRHFLMFKLVSSPIPIPFPQPFQPALKCRILEKFSRLQKLKLQTMNVSFARFSKFFSLVPRNRCCHVISGGVFRKRRFAKKRLRFFFVIWTAIVRPRFFSFCDVSSFFFIFSTHCDNISKFLS